MGGDNYIEILVNRRFLINTVLVIGVILSIYYSYKRGYNKGAAEMYEYIAQSLENRK